MDLITARPGPSIYLVIMTGTVPVTPGQADDAARQFAEQLCVPGRFQLYVPGGSNDVDGVWRNAADVVPSGRAYLGEVRSCFYVIDCDTPNAPQLAEFRRLVDALGLEFLECDSGSREREGSRHLIVPLPVVDPGYVRGRLEQERHRLNKESGSSTTLLSPKCIRPPLAPHRRSGLRSLPLNMDLAEALEFVTTHTREDTHAERLPTATPPVTSLGLPKRDLPAEALDLLEGGVPQRFVRNGVVLRGPVDAALAVHCVRCGWTLEEFLSVRGVGGTHPSPKTAYKSTDAATKYLVDKYLYGVEKVGETLRMIDEIQEALERSVIPFERRDTAHKAQLLMRAILERARRLCMLEFAYSQRDMEHDTGLSRYMVRKLVQGLVKLGVLQPGDEDGQNPGAATYRLVALQLPDRVHERTTLPVAATHPAFHARGFGAPGHLVLTGFSYDMSRRAADAFRVIDGDARIGSSSFYKKVAELAAAEVLIEEPSQRRHYRISSTVDWNALAEQMGSAEVARNRAVRHTIERTGYAQWRKGAEVTDEVETAEPSAEERAESPAERASARRLVVAHRLTISKHPKRVRRPRRGPRRRAATGKPEHSLPAVA